jgi:hypothetical protein
MKRALMLAVLACVPSLLAGAVEESSSPPVPSPTVPPELEAGSPLPSATALPEGRPKPKAARKRPAPPKIRLGEKHESEHTHWTGVGLNTTGKTQAKADGSTLTAVLTGAADAHGFFGILSTSIATVQLVQEFDIVPGDPKAPWVLLSLSGKLEGYVRSESHAAASLRQADAVVYPASGGPAVWLAFPACCGVSDTSASPCKQQYEAPSVTMPAGHYVLVMNLVLEADADGLFRGHGVAVFAPRFHAGTWRSEAAAVESLKEEDFGFAVTLKATAPPSD